MIQYYVFIQTLISKYYIFEAASNRSYIAGMKVPGGA